MRISPFLCGFQTTRFTTATPLSQKSQPPLTAGDREEGPTVVLGRGSGPRPSVRPVLPPAHPAPRRAGHTQARGPRAPDELSPAPSPFLVALGAQEPTGFLPPLPAALPDLQNTPSFTPPTGSDCPEALKLTALL